MAEPDAFEFQDTSATEQLQEVGVSFQHLAKSKGKIPGKDSLVKLLKVIAEVEDLRRIFSHDCILTRWIG
jgi:hypothetical protein